MSIILNFGTKVYSTTDKKRTKKGETAYTYGTINIRTPILARYVGKRVKVTIEIA